LFQLSASCNLVMMDPSPLRGEGSMRVTTW
jgi:hypothetical protein